MSLSAPRRPSPLLVVARELLRSSRGARLVQGRSLFVGVLLLLLTVLWAQGLSDLESGLQNPGLQQGWNPSDLGRQIFWGSVGFQFFVVVLAAPLLMAQGIIEERESKTLEVLSTTRLTPGRVLFGKILSRLLVLEAVLLAALPVLVLAISLGGVSLAELGSSLLQLQVVLIGGSLVSAALAMHARGPFGPAFLTWLWLFGVWVLLPLVFGEFSGLRTAGAAAVSPFFAIEGRGIECIGPALQVVVLAVVAFRVARGSFELLVTGVKSQEDLKVASAYWAHARLRRRLLLLGVPMVLLIAVAVGLGKADPFGAAFHLGILVWVLALVAVILFATIVYLYLVQAVGLYFGRRRGRKTSWKEQARRFDEADQDKLVHRRRFARLRGRWRIWRNPVAWREASFRSRSSLGRRTIWALVSGLGIFFFGLFLFDLPARQARELCVLIGSIYLGLSFPTAVMAATSSIARERSRGTLALLCSTPLSSLRIVWGKMIGVAFVVAPFVAVGFCLAAYGGLVDSDFSLARKLGECRDAHGIGPGAVDPALIDDELWLSEQQRWCSRSLAGLTSLGLSLAWLGAASAMTAVSTLLVALLPRTAGRAWLLGMAWAGLLVAAPMCLVFLGIYHPSLRFLTTLFLPVPEVSFFASKTHLTLGISIGIHTTLTLCFGAVAVGKFRALALR